MEFTAFLAFLQTLHERIFEPDRIPAAVCAMLLVALVGFITGPLRGNTQPALWQAVDLLFGRVGDRLGKPSRTRADLVFRGFLLAALAVFIFALLGRAAEIAESFYPAYMIPEILAVSLCLSGGAGWQALIRLHKVLDKPGSEKGAYYAIAQTTRINLNSTDHFGASRIGMGMLARQFDKGSVAPVLWYLIGGLPVLFGYTALAALSWRFGKDGFSKGFGAGVLALERLMGAVPSVMAGFFLTLASIVTPSAGIARSVISWVSVRQAAPYAQGGWPLSVVAFALKVSLGGPVQDLSGSALKNAWVGPKGASAKVEHRHLHKGLYITVIAQIFWLTALLGAYLYSA